ncbi:6-hydroxymethylpterin diphosphokinase MptE-like protein [Haloferacaceae archaeon DSL9]
MNFETWEPVYEAILADFGFDRAADERARDVAATHAEPFAHSLADLFEGERVTVVGAAPSLADDLCRLDPDTVVVAASSAADVLADAGIAVDCMVTDLDKNPETGRALTESGVPVAAHAHGDNVPALETWLPRYDGPSTLVTTQAEPVENVVNYGGFTDGDRAAFLADSFGADAFCFVGWEFDDPTVDPLKAQKLRWAERLLRWLERRRGERFSVLDGRRAEIEPVPAEDATE